jgi:hypothetical protein
LESEFIEIGFVFEKLEHFVQWWRMFAVENIRGPGSATAAKISSSIYKYLPLHMGMPYIDMV